MRSIENLLAALVASQLTASMANTDCQSRVPKNLSVGQACRSTRFCGSSR